MADSVKYYNLSDDIKKNSISYPNKLAFTYPNKITYSNFWSQIVNISNYLSHQGITKGTKTVVLLKPTESMFPTFFALLRIGAIPVMIDPGMGVRSMLKSLNSISPEAFIGTHKALLLRIIGLTSLNSIKKWISSHSINKSAKITIPNDNSLVPDRHNKEDNAAIFFTSGSTGPAKAVLYTNGMLASQIRILKEQFNYSSNDIDLCTFPLVSLLLLTQGISVVIADMNMLKPSELNPSKVYRNIKENNCTSMFCSPMVLRSLSDYCFTNEIEITSLNKILSAGAPVVPELLITLRKSISNDCNVFTPYGATEALPITNISDKELLNNYDPEISNLNGICIGKPLLGIDLRIIGIDDMPISDSNSIEHCAINEVGEIIVSGENVTKEYFNNQSATELSKIIIDDRIFHRMGDLGRIDENGNIWFYGRKTQRVISNAKIYYTIPTEDVFNKHPQVSRSALVGLTDTRTKLITPVICIEFKKVEKEYDKANIIEELLELASIYDETQEISRFVFVDEFPVDPRHNAKIFREKLGVIAKSKFKL